MVLLAVLLAGVGAVGVAGATPAPAPAGQPGDNSTAEVGDSIVETVVLERLPDRQGKIAVTAEYDLPPSVTGLTVGVWADEVLETTHLERDGRSIFRWDDSKPRENVSVRYVVDVDVWDHERNGSIFVDEGEWALVRTPSAPTTAWRHDDRFDHPSLETVFDVAGDGVVGEDLAFLGSYESYDRSSDAERIELVIPEAADPRADPDDVLDVLVASSEVIDVNDTAERVLVVAAPTGRVQWSSAGRGLPTGAWVVDTISENGTTWIHEYVHTRQAFLGSTTPETEWVVEGSADYYAALLNYEFGGVRYGELEAQLDAGAAERYDDVVLADPTTWRGTSASYGKGALAIAGIDFEIRRATGGEATFQDVFRALNDHEGEIDHETFRDYVAAVGGDGAATAADRYATTTEAAETWDRESYVEVFDGSAPSFAYAWPTPADERFTVTGSSRTDVLGSDPVLVAGETLAVDLVVENEGNAVGEFEVPLTVDGEVVDAERGTLRPGRNASISLSHRFPTRGEYELEAGGTNATVSVRWPPYPTVTSFELSSSSIGPGEPVTMTATLENDEPVPVDRAFAFAIDREPARAERVVLEPGATTTVERTTEFVEGGEFTIAAGSLERTIRVDEPLRPTVVGLSLDPATVRPGATVVVTATVRNEGGVPGKGDVEITVDDEVVHREPIVLDAGAERRVRATVRPKEIGAVEVGAIVRPAEAGTVEGRAGERSATLAVEEATGNGTGESDSTTLEPLSPAGDDDTGTGGGTEPLPGFEPVVTAAALAIAVAIAARRT